ncbi:MAG TPA: hypothetical protein VHC41_06450 [Mycobacteriales bacterium]|nr:hypothetical protein [Mycobacteriales bacterium]
MNLVTSLHVVAAVFFLGPLVFAASASPRALRAGAEGLGTLRFLSTTTRIYGYLSLLVVVFGLANVQHKYGFTFGQTWVWLSLVLTVAALAAFLLVVAPAQSAAVADLQAGRDARGRLPLIAAGSGVASLALLTVVFLMIYKPGL